jgi:hypothetical protein
VGYQYKRNNSESFGGRKLSELIIGSVSVPQGSHKLLTNLVYDKNKSEEDRPFSAIVEAFRFAFALGYASNQRGKREGKAETVAPRQFVVSDYEVLFREICIEEGISLGALCSDFAQGGCEIIKAHLESGGTVLELLE